jgi:hypothetical protein
MADGEIKNGRVKTREFYKALLEQNKARREMEQRQNTRMDEMGQRIIEKIDTLATDEDIDKLDDRLTYQERKSNVQDAVVAIAAGMAAWIFGNR